VPSRLLLILPSTSYRASAFLEAARRLGVAVTVASDHRSTFADAQPANVLLVDCGNPARVTEQACRFAAEHPVDAVFGVDDTTAVAAAWVARALGLRHNSVEACEAARDKHRQRVMLAREGLPVPSFALHRFDGDLAAYARVAPYPCVLKPTHLSMSRGVMRADDPAGFARAVERLRLIATREDAAVEGRETFLVERFVPGDEFALEGMLAGGALRTLALFDKPDPLDGPFFEETRQREIGFTVERAAQALGLTEGPVHAEVRVNADGPWIIEVAARPIGGRCSAILRFGERAAISLEQVLLAQSLGLTVDGEPAAGGQPATVEREPSGAAVMMIPVPRAGTLIAVRGVDDARRVPWVDDVVITAHPGQQLEPLPEGNRYLGFIYAWAEDPATAVAALRAAHANLAIELA
jgi:biotin carboxylase